MPGKKSKKGSKKGIGKAAPKKQNRKAALSTSTTKKSASDKLLKKEFEKLNKALEVGKIGVWEWDLKTDRVKWSDNLFKITGFTKDNIDGTFDSLTTLVDPRDLPAILKAFAKCFDEKSENIIMEFRIFGSEGRIRWIESTGLITYGKNGTPLSVLGTSQDVTERKKIEQESEDWKTRHELVASSAGIVIYDYDIESGEIVWSGNCKDVLGYEPDELGNIDRWVSLIHPDDRTSAFAELEKAEKELKPYDVNYRFRRKRGDYCYMHDRGFFLINAEGRPVRMLGMMSDVTEQVEAERKLKETNVFRESIESAMPDILYVYDIQSGRQLYTNKNAIKQLGYSSEDLHAMGTEIVGYLLHPDDRANPIVWTNEPTGVIKEKEVRLRTKQGIYRWFATRNTPFNWDANGKVTQMIGIAQDVTDKKEFLFHLNKSEQSYRELFDTVGEAIFILGKYGKIIDVNSNATEISGYSKSELVGQNVALLDAEGENDLNQIRLYFSNARKHKTQSFEYWGKRKNGEHILLEIRITKGSYFRQTVMIATARDITLRRHTEQALRDSEQRFRTLQQASFGGIAMHDKGVIIDCNQGLSDITGYSYQELIGFNGLELIAPEHRAVVLEKILSGYDKPYDSEGLRKDGSRYALEVQGKNIPYEGRQIRVTEFRDITARKKSEEKIVEQNARLLAVTEDLMRKNNQLEEFTQIVSHNLRSPVGNIVTLLSFFESASTEEEKEQYIKLLKESSATTLYMLNDLNEVLKVKQNKNIERQHLKFADVLTEVKRMLNAKISQHSAVIQDDFSAAPEIDYPSIYLESIFLNLLDNALKYAHPDRCPEIAFRTTLDERGNIILAVKDNGLGINLERYGHQVFKMRKTFHRHAESRGIGLFMIKNQIEAMGGEISIESEENVGSTFFINFNKLHSHAS